MTILNLNILGKTCLAPMAGITDIPFRLMARKYHVGLVFTGLISVDGLVRKSEKTLRLFRFLPEERPIGIQLFGHDPQVFREAVSIISEFSPDLIDLNLGCPAKSVVKRGAGAALLKNLSQIQKIAEAVVPSSPVPVTAKIRSGWDDSSIVAVEIAKILEATGISAVTVHARTKDKGFKGKADWSVIQAVRQAVSIPVIGNGDVTSPQEAKQMLEQTGCDMVMVGRGALGRPWIFHHIEHYLKTGTLLEEPSFREQIENCLEHYRLALQYLPENRAVYEMRKHIAWYVKGMPGASEFRKEIFMFTDPEQVISRLCAFGENFA